jgi:hypothetical protein
VASEVGALAVEPKMVIQKGRLKPGQMLLVDTVEGCIIDDKELKRTTAAKQNFASWIENRMIQMPNILKHVQRTVNIAPTVTDVTPSAVCTGHKPSYRSYPRRHCHVAGVIYHSMEITIYQPGILVEYCDLMTSISTVSQGFLFCCIFKISQPVS